MTIAKSSRQLNISLIVSDLSSKGAGRWGGAIRPFLLTQALQKLGHNVKIFGIAYEENGLAELPEDLPIISIPCPYYAKFGGMWRSLQQLLPQVESECAKEYHHRTEDTLTRMKADWKIITAKKHS